MSSIRGKCAVCDREDMPIQAKGCCSSCYTVLVGNNGDLGKAREYRAEHPVRAMAPRPKRGEPMNDKAPGAVVSKARPAKKKEIDLMAVTVNSRDKNRKISIAFDLDIQISNVRINGSWPDPEPEPEEE